MVQTMQAAVAFSAEKQELFFFTRILTAKLEHQGDL